MIAKAAVKRYPVSQAEIDSILAHELKNVKTVVKPIYNPRLRCDGKTIISEPFRGFRKIESIQIGPQAKRGRKFLIDTILHEELEARIALRGGYLDDANSFVRHKYIQRVIDKFVRMKEI